MTVDQLTVYYWVDQLTVDQLTVDQSTQCPVKKTQLSAVSFLLAAAVK